MVSPNIHTAAIAVTCISGKGSCVENDLRIVICINVSTAACIIGAVGGKSRIIVNCNCRIISSIDIQPATLSVAGIIKKCSIVDCLGGFMSSITIQSPPIVSYIAVKGGVGGIQCTLPTRAVVTVGKNTTASIDCTV